MAFNWGLARVKAVMDQRAAETTYGIAGDDLTPAISWSLYGLRKDWNAAKDTAAPWWPECSKEAFNTGLDQLARALKNWAGSRNGQRKGNPAGFPRFKSRRKARPSIRFTTGAFGCEARHAVLPRIGRVKLHEPGTRLADLEYKAARRGGTVIAADRWFASSKTCSGCAAVKAKLLLSERTYLCAACGTVADGVAARLTIGQAWPGCQCGCLSLQETRGGSAPGISRSGARSYR